MALDLSVPKEFNAGTYVSLTVISEGGAPTAEIKLAGDALSSEVKWLSEAKYKVIFSLPAGTSGKDGEITVRHGSESAEAAFKIA